MGADYALASRIPLEIFEADWARFGRKAGPLRNTQIVDACDKVLALPSHKGKGTQDTIKKAEKRGKTRSSFGSTK